VSKHVLWYRVVLDKGLLRVYCCKRILLECRAVCEFREHLTTHRFSYTSNERKSDVFSRRLKADSDGDGRQFQMRAAATPKARSPTVTRRVGGMFSSSVEAEPSRGQKSMSATRRSSSTKCHTVLEQRCDVVGFTC